MILSAFPKLLPRCAWAVLWIASAINLPSVAFNPPPFCSPASSPNRPSPPHLWEGHDGARLFYTTFLGAFPDVKFELTDIVIGPQGVFEVAQMTGTHLGPWANFAASGKCVRTTVIIFFPWNPAAGKFAGEKIYFDQAALGGT